MARFLKILLLLLGIVIPLQAQVSITNNNPPYDWVVMQGAKRQLGYQIVNGTTNLVNYTGTGVSLSCTSNCQPTVGVTVTMAGSTCPVTGTVGAYAVNAANIATVTATSVDDVTKHTTTSFRVCDTSSALQVFAEPFYAQVFPGKLSPVQSYVIGETNLDVTWAITVQPGGGDGVLVDSVNRDTYFHATVHGRYTICATEVATGAISGCAIRYVSTATFSNTTTPVKTMPTPCEVDPALTGTIYDIGPTQTYHTMNAIGAVQRSLTAGSMIRIHNEDTTGLAPTTYHEYMQIGGNGTPTQPIIICGVPDSAGRPPRLNGSGATTDSGNSNVITGLGAFAFFNSNPFGTGYNLGSAGPDYFNVTGLGADQFNVTYQYYPAGSATPVNYGDVQLVWAFAGRHIYIAGNDMNDIAEGILMKNSTVYSGQTFSGFHQFIGNHERNQGYGATDFGEHGFYAQGLYSLIEGNLFEQPTALDANDFGKMRGGYSIIRYNTFKGPMGGHMLEYPDMEDTWQFVSIDGMLGVPGDTNCADSVQCTVTSNNITIPQLVANAQALDWDWVYGNIFFNQLGNGASQYIQYGSYSAPNECPPCTNMVDRNGQLFSYANTFDQPTEIYQTANPYSSIPAAAQYAYTTILSQNNIMWIDTAHKGTFGINFDGTSIIQFLTNLYNTGTVSITTPINGGNPPVNGWGNYTNAFSFTGAIPLNNHMTGLSSGNFLLSTSNGPPYNRITYAPISGSAAINAGSALTDANITHNPVRFQPDPLNGYQVPRTDSASSTPTIGAVQTGTDPSYTMSIVPSSVSTPYVSGGTISYIVDLTYTSPAYVLDASLQSSYVSSDNGCLGYFSSPELQTFAHMFSTCSTQTPGITATIDTTSTATSPFTLTSGPPPTVVSVAILPGTVTIPVGSTQGYTCTATLSDSSTATCSTQGTVTWTSSSTPTATINSSGVGTAVALGSTTITATVSSITSPGQTLNVIVPFVVPPGLVGTTTIKGTTTYK